MTDINQQMLPPPMLARRYMPCILASPGDDPQHVLQAVENIANILEEFPDAMHPIPNGAFRYTDPDQDLQLQTLVTKLLRGAGVFDENRDGWLQVCEYLRAVWMARRIGEYLANTEGGDYAT